MEVIVDCCGGSKPFLLKVGRFDTVGKIKEKIEEQEGIPISRQTICFNDEILPDDINVGDSGIVDGSTLLLFLPADQHITVNNNQFHPADDSDPHFSNNVDLNLSLLNYLLKSNILDRYPIEPPTSIRESPADAPLASNISEQSRDQFTFHHKLPTSKELTENNQIMEVIFHGSDGFEPFLLKVGDIDTSVGEIKEKIELGQGIPISRQTICFNGEILPDDFNVGNVGDGSTPSLLLLISADQDDINASHIRMLGLGVLPHRRAPASVCGQPTMNVVVRFNDELTNVQVRKNEPMSELLRRLRQKGVHGVPDVPIFSIRGDRGDILLNDEISFARNGIGEGDVIDLYDFTDFL